MLSGHYAVGLGLKSVDRTIPLWFLFIATQLVDIAFMVLVLFDIEHLRIIPGYTKIYPLDMYHFPYSHGLLMVPFWCLLAIVLYRAINRLTTKSVIIISIAVSSHWFLDYLVHPKDLPLIFSSTKVGMSLWNQPITSILLETILVIVALACFLTINTPNNRKGIQRNHVYILSLCTLLIILNVVMPFYPTPKSILEVCIVGLCLFAIFPLSAYYFEPKMMSNY